MLLHSDDGIGIYQCLQLCSVGVREGLVLAWRERHLFEREELAIVLPLDLIDRAVGA